MIDQYIFHSDQARSEVVKFLQDILDGRIYLREVKHERKLDWSYEYDHGYHSDNFRRTLEPTGEETFTFEITRQKIS